MQGREGKAGHNPQTLVAEALVGLQGWVLWSFQRGPEIVTPYRAAQRFGKCALLFSVASQCDHDTQFNDQDLPCSMKGGIQRSLIVHLLKHNVLYSLRYLDCISVSLHGVPVKYVLSHPFSPKVEWLANIYVLGRHAWCQNSSPSFMIQPPSGLMGFWKRTELEERLVHTSLPNPLALLWPQVWGLCSVSMVSLYANPILTFLLPLFGALQIT